MSEDVRNYLIQRFNDGPKTGNKADSKQVEHEMKHARNTTGGLLFQPYEWRAKHPGQTLTTVAACHRKSGTGRSPSFLPGT